MKALVYKGNRQCALEDHPMPELRDPTDALVKGEFYRRPLEGSWGPGNGN